MYNEKEYKRNFNASPRQKRLRAIYKIAHRKENRARDKIYRENHIEYFKVYRKKYYQSKKQALLKQQRAYQYKHRHRISIRTKAYRASHNSEIRGMKERYYQNNKAILRAKDRARGYVSVEVVKLVYKNNIKKYGILTCYLCLKPISLGKDHLEHKTPISRGGKNIKRNLGVACKRCNCVKRHRTVKEYFAYLEE